MNVPAWMWIATIVGLLVLLAVDLVIVDRKPHEVTIGEAARWVVFYVAVRGAVRPRHLDLLRRHVRGRVLRRLHHRVLAERRQPVHLPDHHDDVQGARDPPAQGAAGRHPAGAGHARHLHRRRRGADRAVQLGLLRLRRVPDLHRLAAAPGSNHDDEDEEYKENRHAAHGAQGCSRSPTTTTAPSRSSRSTASAT